MAIKATLKAKIEALTSLTVYLSYAPQRTTAPYAVLHRIASPDLGFDQGGRESWNRETFQLDLIGPADSALETARNAVITGMHGQTPTTWSSQTIYSCLIDDTQDTAELENESGEAPTFRQTIDITVTYAP